MYSSSYGYGGAAGVAQFQLLLSLAAVILMFAAQWRLFTKAGEPGWKCLIPFYGAYTWCKIVWNEKIFFTMLGMGIGTGVLSGIMAAMTANSRGGPGAGATIVMLLAAALAIAALIIGIRMLIYTARAYGQSGAFAVGLFFLAPIFFCILGFGSSEYIGPMGIPGMKPSRDAADDSFVADGYNGEKEWDGDDARSASRSNLIWSVIGVCALILCIGAVYRWTLAMTKYRPTRGMFDNPWVGFDNFNRLISNPSFAHALTSSVLYGIFGIVVSLVFSLLGWGAASAGRTARAIAVALGAAVAFVPVVVLDQALIRMAPRTVADGAFQPMLLIWHMLPIGGVSVMLGALLPGAWSGQNRFSGVLIAPLLTLSSFLMDTCVTDLLQNNMNRSYTDRLSTYITSTGYMKGQFSVAAAAEVVQSLLNLIPAIIGAILIALLVKKARPALGMPVEKSRPTASVAAGAAAGFLILAFGIALFSRGSVLSDVRVQQSVIISLVSALLVAVLAFGIYFGALICARHFDHARWLPIALLILLSTGFHRISIAEYLIAHHLGLSNTIVMPVLDATVNPLSVMLLLGILLLRPRRMSACLLSALGIALLSAAYVMGDVNAFYIHVRSASQANLGMLLQNVLQSRQMDVSGLDAPATDADNLRLSLIGLTLMLVSLPIGVGAGFCVHAAQAVDPSVKVD